MTVLTPVLAVGGVSPTMADTYPAAVAERAAERAAADAAASAAAADALTSLAARLRHVASTVAEQAALQRQLVDVDWQGWAADMFKDAVQDGASDLAALVGRLEELSDEVLRRASLVGDARW